jgi:hypothetical protein
MTHRQVPQGFPDTSQVSLHKNNEINLRTYKIAVPAGMREVAAAFNFISERTVDPVYNYTSYE